MKRFRSLMFPVVLSVALAAHILTTAHLSRMPRAKDPRELDAVLPWYVQVLAAGGDRYLAGDISAIRALWSSTQDMRDDEFALLGRLHATVSLLHPAHEDNYYVAAAILPWNGQYEAAQQVLKAAAGARTFDWLPYFYYGFDLWYFARQPLEAAEWIRMASNRAVVEDDRLALEVLAVKWAERGYDVRTASRMLKGMAAQARIPGLRRYYEARAQRLDSLITLEEAAKEFALSNRRPPSSLSELVAAGVISRLPVDPLGVGYGLDAAGRPRLLDKDPPKSAQ